MAHLLLYIRYIYNHDINKDLLFCQLVYKHTIEINIFQKVDTFITEMSLQWKNCVGVRTDEAIAMTGHTAGFQGRVQVMRQ